MLSNVSTAATAVAPKTIAITRSSNAQNNSIMYTVPTGRKFKGLIGHNGSYQLSVDGNDIGPFHFYSGGPWQAPIELAAGAVVRSYPSNTGYSMLFGVESDA